MINPHSLLQRGLLLILIFGSTSAEDVTLSNATDDRPLGPSIRYPLPEVTMKILVLDEGLQVTEFQRELEKVTSMHLSANLRRALPETGPLGLDSFIDVELVVAVVDKVPTNSTAADSRSRVVIETFVRGNSVFADHLMAPPSNSSEVNTFMLGLLRFSFGDEEEYARLIARYQASDALAGIKGVLITVQNTNYTPPPPDKASPLNVAIIVVVVLLLVLVLAMFYYFYQRRRRSLLSRIKRREIKSRFGSKRRVTAGDTDVESDGGSPPRRPHTLQDQPGPEEWMDEWAEKMTSIPLRQSSPPSKARGRRPLPRPAQRGSSDLDAIVEESDVSESTSIADASVADLSVDSNHSPYDSRHNKSKAAPGALGRIDDDFDDYSADDDDGEYLSPSMIAV